jgi:type III restriction enzyme
VNNLGTFGRWAFAELTDVYQMEADFETQVGQAFERVLDEVAPVIERVS